MTWRLWQCKTDRVSAAWLRQQALDAPKRGVDGVSIQFPIRRLLNATSWVQTVLLKKKAS